ncbi:MAG: hypothetical protein B6247_28180, partial [Candidatus Parabeggiatoa sp. nov. 2]
WGPYFHLKTSKIVYGPQTVPNNLTKLMVISFPYKLTVCSSRFSDSQAVRGLPTYAHSTPSGLAL